MKRIETFDDLKEATQQGEPAKIAVVNADNDDVLLALQSANREGYIKGYLIGDKNGINQVSIRNEINISDFEIIHSNNETSAAFIALELVRSMQADIIMKGNISTGKLLSVLLDRERGIRAGKLLSHVSIFQLPGKSGFKFMSDAAINIKPTCFEKISICQNAIKIANALGYMVPKVALITPFEKVFLDEIPSTIDAALISKMGERGQIAEACFDGPISLDIALSPEAAKEKGYSGLIKGDADIFIVHDLETGNVFYKALIYFVDCTVSGIIAGAQVPIVLTSRADHDYTKHLSIITAVYLSRIDKKDELNEV